MSIRQALMLLHPERPVCNCGDAYKKDCETIACSAAQIAATEILAREVVKLKGKGRAYIDD